MANWSIVESQYRIMRGVGGHNLLVLKDPTGKVVAELDGLAFGADGLPKPIGILPTDQLKVKLSKGAYLYDNDQPQVEIASGDQATIMNLWAAAKASGDQINSLNLRYPPLGVLPPNSPLGPVLNSNSVASTMISAMGLVERSIPGGALLTPGRGNVLLDQNAINDIQSKYSIQSPRQTSFLGQSPPAVPPDGASNSPWSAVPPEAVPLPRARPSTPPRAAPLEAVPLPPPRPSAPPSVAPIHLPRFNSGGGGLRDAVVREQLPPAVPGALLDDGYPDDWHVPPSAQGDGFPDDWYVLASAMLPNAAQPARAAQQSFADPTGSYQQPAQERSANPSDAELNSAVAEYYRLKSGVDAPSVRDTLGLYPMPSLFGGLSGARPIPSLSSPASGGGLGWGHPALFGGVPPSLSAPSRASFDALSGGGWGPMYARVTLPPPGSFFPLLIGGVVGPTWSSPQPESEDDEEED